MTDQEWTLGKVIALFRKEADKNQSEVADVAGVGVMAISAIENDKTNPGTDTLQGIAKALGTTEAAIYLRRDRLNAGLPDTPGLAKVADLTPRRRSADRALSPAVIELAEQLQDVPRAVVQMALDIATLSDHAQLAIHAVMVAFKADKR